MGIFKLIRAFQKANGRSPSPSELDKLKQQADIMSKQENVIPFPQGGKDKLNPFDDFKASEDAYEQAQKLTPIEAMKEANNLIGRKGKYKNISSKDAEKKLGELEEIIKSEKLEPEDLVGDDLGDMLKDYDGDPDAMAAGGLAGAITKLQKKFGKKIIQKGKAPKKSEKKKLKDLFKEFNKKNMASGGLAGLLGEEPRSEYGAGGGTGAPAVTYGPPIKEQKQTPGISMSQQLIQEKQELEFLKRKAQGKFTEEPGRMDRVPMGGIQATYDGPRGTFEGNSLSDFKQAVGDVAAPQPGIGYRNIGKNYEAGISAFPNKITMGGTMKFADGGRTKYGIGNLVKEKISPEYRLYAKSILPGGESGKVDESYFTEDFKKTLRTQALEKFKETGELKGSVNQFDQIRGFRNRNEELNELVGMPSTYASLGAYSYEIDPKTLDVKIKDRYDWNPSYGKIDKNRIGFIDNEAKEGRDVDLTMMKDFAKNAIKEGRLDKANALELIGNYFGGKESQGTGFDVDINIPTQEATTATEGSFAQGGRIGFKKGGMDRRSFLKLMGGLASIPILGKFIKPVAKVAETAAPVIAEGVKLGYDKFLMLVNKIKKLGRKTDAVTQKEREVGYVYKGKDGNEYELVEDITTGDVRVTKDKPGGMTIGDESFDTIEDRSTFVLRRNQADETTKGRKPPDEYDEMKEISGPDGTFDDIDEVSDISVKEILEELGETKIKKAGGGIAHMLGE